MDDAAQNVRAGPKLSVAFDWRHFFSEQDIKLQCDRYNSYCCLLHQSEKLQLVDETRSNAVQQDVLELEHILKDAKDAINSKLQDLDKSVQLFASDIAADADPRWYRGVNDLTGTFPSGCSCIASPLTRSHSIRRPCFHAHYGNDEHCRRSGFRRLPDGSPTTCGQDFKARERVLL